jgi:diguanylate cyclase (GGDEF)-like protein/PAS domain S-box-containing protein
VTLRFVDAMHRHGVYICLFETVGSAELMELLRGTPALRPKVSLIQKNEMAFVLQIDEATTQMLGWTADELIGRRTLEFLDPEDHPRAIASWMDMLRAPGSRRRVRLRHRHRDGSWVWFEVTNHNLLNDPAHGYVLTEMLDISDEMAAQEALRQREHLLRRLTETLPLGILQVDTDRRVVYRNARLAAITGESAADTIEEQLACVLPSDQSDLLAALDAVLLEGRDRDMEIGVGRGADDIRRCTLSLRALTDDTGTPTGAIVTIADVTDSVRMRRELEDRATYDVLTRCYNRASILHLLELALGEHVHGTTGTGVVFLDLDRFKDLNDRLGHAAGDTFLVEVARRLMASVRGGDVVGRLGGDEFLVVCRGVESAAEAELIAQRIIDLLAEASVDLGGEHVAPRASVGVAWCATSGVSADALVARADQAMYEAKRQRLGRPVVLSAAPRIADAA